MIIVEATGVQSLIQDEGRPGLASIGVTRSGSFDREAAELANRLVGNATSAAVVETIGHGLRLRTDQDVLVAVTGAVGDVVVSGRRCSRNTGLQLSGHDTVEIAPTAWGGRSYVAVRGGVAVARTLGSRSCDTLGHLGPPPLQIGDWLPVGPAHHPAPPIDHAPAAPTPGPATLRVTAGPRRNWFPADSWELLVRAEWQVAPSSNRVGIRLTGPRLDRAAGFVGLELPPEGLVRGAIQVPPDGQPIIMGPDHPTTGGYPVIGVVMPADLSRCAQLLPGETVNLRAILVAGR